MYSTSALAFAMLACGLGLSLFTIDRMWRRVANLRSLLKHRSAEADEFRKRLAAANQELALTQRELASVRQALLAKPAPQAQPQPLARTQPQWQPQPLVQVDLEVVEDFARTIILR